MSGEPHILRAGIEHSDNLRFLVPGTECRLWLREWQYVGSSQWSRLDSLHHSCSRDWGNTSGDIQCSLDQFCTPEVSTFGIFSYFVKMKLSGIPTNSFRTQNIHSVPRNIMFVALSMIAVSCPPSCFSGTYMTVSSDFPWFSSFYRGRC